MNPNGVFFKPGARVNVGGLVASGLNISDKDFLAGKYYFAHDGKGAPGAVINQGLIQAATGGAVSLIGGGGEERGDDPGPCRSGESGCWQGDGDGF